MMPYPIISLDRNARRLTLFVKIPLTGDTFDFSFHAETEWSARLLANAVLEAFNHAMKRVRREAYEQGWRDAKAKRRKEDWFSTEWP